MGDTLEVGNRATGVMLGWGVALYLSSFPRGKDMFIQWRLVTY